MLFICKRKLQGVWIATHLMKKSCEVLETDFPIATVSDKNLPQLQGIIDQMGFKFSYKKKGVYQKDNTEHYFNNEATEILKNNILSPLLLLKNSSKQN